MACAARRVGERDWIKIIKFRLMTCLVYTIESPGSCRNKIKSLKKKGEKKEVRKKKVPGTSPPSTRMRGRGEDSVRDCRQRTRTYLDDVLGAGRTVSLVVSSR